jgi:hypothetical protein
LPQSLLCRLAGVHHGTIQHVVVWVAIALLGAWVVDALRGRSATSWDLFAFTCAISTMVSPIAWSHYQIMLAPLFVLLVVRFTSQGAHIAAWAGVAVAYVLASLIWSPHGTLVDAVRLRLPSAFQANPHPLVTELSQFAQYILIATGALWYAAHRHERRRWRPLS